MPLCPKGVVDLVKMKALIWSGEELGAKFDEVDIPEDMKEKAQEYRDKLIDQIVELDDEVLNAYFEVSHKGVHINVVLVVGTCMESLLETGSCLNEFQGNAINYTTELSSNLGA